MSDRPSPTNPSEFGEDSDLRQILAAIWETRRLVAMTAIAASSLFWLGSIALGLRSGVHYEWDSEIEFVFDGIESGQYPDGSPFNPLDLTLPTVLNRVYEINALWQYGMTRPDFIEAITIAEAAPTGQFVRSRYTMLLGSERTPMDQMREIEREYAAAMRAASHGYAALSLGLRSRPWPGRPVLPSAIAAKVLLDIPRIWALYMTEETAAFALRLDLHTVKSLESSNLRDLDPLIAYDAIQRTLDLLDLNLDRLAAIPQAVTTRDPDSQRSIKDLRSRVAELRGFVVEDVLGPSVTAAASPDPRAITDFFRNRIEDIRHLQETLLAQAGQIERVVVEYSESSKPNSAAGSGGIVEDLRGVGGGAAIPQFGSDFLDRLVRFGSESTALSFRQDLSRQRLDCLLRAAGLNLEIRRLEEFIELITEAASGENPAMLATPDSVESLSVRLDALLDELGSLFNATERIGVRILELGSGGVVAPYRTMMLQDRPRISDLVIQRSTLRLYAMAISAIAFMTMLGGLLHRMVTSVPRRAATD